MSSDDQKKGRRSNPWGTAGRSQRPRRTGGGGHGTGPSDGDLHDMLERAKQNFSDVIPGGNGGDGGKGVRFLTFGAVVLAGIWAVSGFYVVNPGENAIIQRFGEWTSTKEEPGLGYHLPVPIEKATVLNVEEIRKLTIGFTDTLSYGRKLSAREVPNEAQMLTSDRNIVDLHLIIQWNIKSAGDFAFNIQAQERTIKKVAESAIREVVGQTDMFPIITTGRASVAQRAQEIIQRNLDSYEAGVNITQVLIDKAEVHPEVQGGFQDVQSAKQDAENVRNRAEAYREDIIPKARGLAKKMLQEADAYQQSKVAKSTGDAERFKSVYTAYLSGKDVTKQRIYIETMEEVLKNADKIIIDQKQGASGIVPYLPLNEISKKKGQ